MESYYAPAGRADQDALQRAISTVGGNPLMSTLMDVVGGAIAVVNSQRQVVAVNHTFLETLGIDDPETTLGLRPGEVVGCIHAGDEPAGCGTTVWCRSCGAAIAMVTSLKSGKPIERLCSLQVARGTRNLEMDFNVRSQPIELEGQTFLLLFLHDVTRQQRQAALERTFYHDINNSLSMLLGASELLRSESPSDLAKAIHQTSERLVKEVAIQRCLSGVDHKKYEPAWETIDLLDLFKELGAFFASHPAAKDRHLDLRPRFPQQLLHTDVSLLLRVLQNMIINALEATEPHGQVKVWVERTEKDATFIVWNSQQIPADIAPHIFERNFSSKPQDGRGTGTFAMKLLGEEYLGGKVSFTTNTESGTLFRYKLPLVWRGAISSLQDCSTEIA